MWSLQALVLCTVWATSVSAGDFTHWLTTTCWETSEQEAVTYWNTATFWETQWSTSTLPPETVYDTVWSTYVDSTTYISVETTTETETTTEFIYSTENNYYTNTATETQVSRETATATATATETGTVTATEVGTVTVTATATVTSAAVVVSSLFATVTEACTTSLAGLVLCPYRDVNPTYTPPGPLPTDYLWGCPPGTLCTPKQINCNFERDLPADTYFCDPYDCVVPPPLPPLNNAEIDYSCTPYVPAPGYPNLNPIPFGLNYSIFEFNGQPGNSCPPPAPTTTTWADWTSSVPAPAPPTTTWADWSSSPAPPPSSSWADWSSPSQPPPPHSPIIATRMELRGASWVVT